MVSSMAFNAIRPETSFAADGVERIQFGNHELHPWQDATALINYAGPYHSYPQYSLT